MSEYRRKTLIGAVVAVILASALAGSTYYLTSDNQHTASSSGNSSTSTAYNASQTNSTTSAIYSTNRTASFISSEVTSSSVRSSSVSVIINVTSRTKSEQLPSECIGGNPVFKMGENLIVNGTGFLCVRYFYYGSQRESINPIDQLTITGASNETTFDGSSNFQITTSQTNMTLGGQENLNEGDLIIYSITAKPSASGTYVLSLGWLLPALEQCLPEILLISGNGLPDYSSYASMGGCITITYASPYGQSQTNATTTSLPYPYPPNYLFAQIVSITNATR